MAVPHRPERQDMEPVSLIPRFTHVYGLCPNCADSRSIPAMLAPEHELVCGWCGHRGQAIEWVKRGRDERSRMGFDAGPEIDA